MNKERWHKIMLIQKGDEFFIFTNVIFILIEAKAEFK